MHSAAHHAQHMHITEIDAQHHDAPKALAGGAKDAAQLEGGTGHAKGSHEPREAAAPGHGAPKDSEAPGCAPKEAAPGSAPKEAAAPWAT